MEGGQLGTSALQHRESTNMLILAPLNSHDSVVDGIIVWHATYMHLGFLYIVPSSPMEGTHALILCEDIQKENKCCINRRG